MGQPLLEVERLRVEYENVVAVDDVSFTVEAGMVYGLVGPNGAGKTSVIRTVANLVEPTWGRVRVAGVDALEDPRGALRAVGFMPDFPPLYEDLTVREMMELFASSYGLPVAARPGRIRDLLARVDLVDKTDQETGSLSRGMRQRLFLAKTLLHDPEVLLLDEPASGLDPLARMDLGAILAELGQQGKAVLVSSHILPEMADYCNAVGVMERGRMVVSGRVEEILGRLKPGLVITARLVAPDTRLGEALRGRPGVHDVTLDGATATFRLEGPEHDASALLRALVQEGFPVVDFHHERGDLRDVFMRVSTGVVS
jgi:ABC-2 type transport system ATP-binding protein